MPLPELMPGTKKNLMKQNKKVIWITGASSGIGEALAKIYSERGQRLILSSRRESSLEEVRLKCSNPDNIKILPLDLKDFDDATVKVEKAYDFFGRIDILINNADISQRSLIADTQFDIFKKLIYVD